MEKCIFCEIAAGRIPSTKVYEDEDVLAFRDINPLAPVHVLVIPKRKIARLEELADRDGAEAGRFMLGIIKVVQQLDLAADGYRIVLNSGRAGQQSVAYAHAHILGGRQMTWPPG